MASAPARQGRRLGAWRNRAAVLAVAATLGACAAPSPPPSGRGPDPALAAAGAVAEVVATYGADCRAGGGAVHVGGGRFLTASHVVDGLVAGMRGCQRSPSPAFTLSVAGTPAPANLLRTGQGRLDPPVGLRYAGGADLALLGPARPLPSLGTAAPCPADPRPGQELLLVTPRRAERLRVVALVAEADPRFGHYAELPLAMAPGESGGAAFDAATGCLAGLVSHREEEATGTRTRLVTPGAIRRFLAE